MDETTLFFLGSKRARSICVGGLLSGVLLAGCTASEGDAAGMETAACIDGGCFDGLECRSDICVSTDDNDTDSGSGTGGPSGTANTSAASSSTSSGTSNGTTTNDSTSLTSGSSTEGSTTEETTASSTEATTDATTETTETTGSDDSSGDTTTSVSDDDTIYDIQDGTIPEGTTVTVSDAIVTATAPSSLFVQAAAGGEYSGIVVFSGDGGPDLSAVRPGDEVTVTGNVFEFSQLTEIVVTEGSFEITASPGAANVPAPVTITASEISEAWEGVFVRIAGDTFTVTGLNPTTVTDSNAADAVIDNFVYDIVNDGGLDVGFGSTFTSIQGPLNGFLGLRIAPRSLDDVGGFANSF